MKSVPKSSRPRLCPKCVGLGFGIVWGLAILITGWIAMTGWGYNFVDVMSSIYTGYCPSFIGGIIGGIWGFFFAGILGTVFSVIHNKIAKCC